MKIMNKPPYWCGSTEDKLAEMQRKSLITPDDFDETEAEYKLRVDERLKYYMSENNSIIEAIGQCEGANLCYLIRMCNNTKSISGETQLIDLIGREVVNIVSDYLTPLAISDVDENKDK